MSEKVSKKAGEKLQAVRGMSDLLPADIGAWQEVEAVLRDVARLYGYREIRTPLVENIELFTQSIGEQTDIVEKEMYVLGGGDDNLALRPEATAGTVRACNQHGLLHNAQQRLWYLGAMFRRERPQKGRYRQFHQFGIEAFGWAGADIDAEIISVGARIWKNLGLRDIKLQLNTLGSPTIRTAYRDALQAYLRDCAAQLDPDSKRRLEKNPLRILDSKIPETIAVVADAPDIFQFLDADARRHFDRLCDALTRGGIEFEVNPKLVRGLDYYTATVFEWVGGAGAQNALCAGGRYDRLVELRGGAPTPAIGFALGLERVVEMVAVRNDGRDRQTSRGDAADVYVVGVDGHGDGDGDGHGNGAVSGRAIELAETLRSAGIAVVAHCGGGKLKKQMKHADRSGARFAVICGASDKVGDKVGDGNVQVKILDSGAQHEIAAAQLVDWCRRHIDAD